MINANHEDGSGRTEASHLQMMMTMMFEMQCGFRQELLKISSSLTELRQEQTAIKALLASYTTQGVFIGNVETRLEKLQGIVHESYSGLTCKVNRILNHLAKHRKKMHDMPWDIILQILAWCPPHHVLKRLRLLCRGFNECILTSEFARLNLSRHVSLFLGHEASGRKASSFENFDVCYTPENLYDKAFFGSWPENYQLAYAKQPRLSRLKELHWCQVEGLRMIPAALSNLTQLERLALETCSLQGPLPHLLGNLVNLECLSFYDNALSGSLPLTLFTGLKNLNTLDLSSNDLTGEIPPEVCELRSLQNLFLCDNRLSGRLPIALCTQMPQLKTLYLSKNQFDGTIPKEVNQLCSLTNLWLNGNAFGGSIPHEIGDLKNLIYLSLANNELTGTVPRDILRLEKLRRCDISGNIRLLCSFEFPVMQI